MSATLAVTLAACGRSPSKAFDRGVASYRDGNFAKAAGYFEKAVHGATPTAQAWNFLGVCQLQTGNTADAIKSFQATLELDPSHAPARYNLALAYLETNQPDQAIPLLRQLTQAGQCPPSVYYQLGHAYVTTGAWAPAKLAFAKLTDADTSADIQNSLGVIETRLGNFKQAKTHLESAAHLDPNLPAVYLNLATLEHHYLGQKSVAVQHYQKFLELLPKSEQREDIRLAIAQLTQDTSKPVEIPVPKPVEPKPAPPQPVVVPNVPVVEKIEPKPAPVVVITPVAPVVPPKPVVKRRTPVSVGTLKAGDRTKAKTAFNEGITQQQQGKPNAAIAAYGRAVAADPSFAQPYYNLAIAYVEMRLADKALDNYELALAADPDFSNARYNYAIILQKQGYLTDALAQYELFLAKNPKDASLHLIAASLYARDPQTKDKARQHYQAVQKLTPDSPAGRDARDWLSKNP
ncbi:MAG: tetratricopeptide repeat protein [Verrucomicrobiota bacterium]